MSIEFTRRLLGYTGFPFGSPLRVTRSGRWFAIEGQPTELFPQRVLAEALERRRMTVQRWQATGRIPETLYRRPVKVGTKVVMLHLYSATQILNAHTLYVRLGRPTQNPKNMGPLKEFFRLLPEALVPGVVVDPHTGDLWQVEKTVIPPLTVVPGGG